ncbi:DUF998 domain-containing protein [Microbacterium testaceum]|uniref:DUF998 domain-containing protein n=1 Tax=Microbacterium testaceum TaxID=2033 RepID=UPI0025B185AF|nr:DUF998 domain-containing protein [Microbacterium testaceum]WJS89941.1 DUF998 domain-containing protein [Microbacterium testaceum]
MHWPDGYSIAGNAISDPGVTRCGIFADAGSTPRSVCSPWHPVFNAGLIACGALTALGAILLHKCWTGAVGRAGTTLIALSGLYVIGAGAAPWDVAPDIHDTAAFGQALTQWLAMGILATAAGACRFRTLTVATTLVSISAFVAFLMALEGTVLPGLSLGISERLAFDTMTLWTAITGVTSFAALRPCSSASELPRSAAQGEIAS